MTVTVTKLEHSCLVLTDDRTGANLIIDPGNHLEFARLAPFVDQAVGVIITHAHPDHLYQPYLDRLRQAQPDLPVLTTEKTAVKLLDAQGFAAGQSATISPFQLDFFGGRHAPIHHVLRPENLGVLVNGVFSYPGDSFELPPVRPQVAAIPVGGPWYDSSMALEYFETVQPSGFGFNVHDWHYSPDGLATVGNFISGAMTQNQLPLDFRLLTVGQSFQF